ncbi:MAG: hypothetical protein P4L84_01235 [Isosphaeraceae bacterium]|nr:hypothetical protein [Isosphaeraceae bacterium]
MLALLPGLLGQALPSGAEKDDPGSQTKHERLLDIYTHEMEGYTIYRDASRAEKAVLRPKPVYLWSNPLRAGGQDGAVFVWTCRGRAEVVGTAFSFPSKGPRGLVHELHSLATTVLDVTRKGAAESGAQTWAPRAPGISLAAIPRAPAPAQSPAQRLVQMRALTREFSGTTQDQEKRTWDLRLLPQPLYRYESSDPDVLDGGVFAFVSSAGTDPEAILIVEARKAPGTAAPAWQYGLARYTDMKLRMRHQNEEVFSAPLLLGSPDFRESYRIFHDREIPAVENEKTPPGC